MIESNYQLEVEMVKGKDLKVMKEFRGKGVIFLVSLFILCGWSTPINISNTDSTSYIPSACLDFSGRLHVVWEERTPLGDLLNDIYYTCQVGSVWTIPVNVSNDSFASWRPDVAVDTLNRVHVVWGNYETGKIMWTMCEDGVWTTPVSISDSVPYACVAPEIAVNPLDNAVHCVWHDLGSATTDAEIWHTYFDGETWSVPENVTNDTYDSGWPDIAIDSLGRIHLVWMDYGTYDIFYSCWNGTTWTSPVNISNLSGQSCAPRIAIDRDNNPHVVWEERIDRGGIYYIYFNGVNWETPTLIDTAISGEIVTSQPDISIDRFNKAHIVWRRQDNEEDNIYYALYSGSINETALIGITAISAASATPRILTDSLKIHVICEDYTSGKGDIFYLTELLLSSETHKECLEYPSMYFRVFILKKISRARFQIYDIVGRKVREGIIKENEQIRISFPSGVYFLRLKVGDKVFWHKFILLNP